MDLTLPIRFNGGMKTLILAAMLAFSPLLIVAAPAQTRLPPKAAAARVDNCVPIGRTANGELVYSMKCETLPAPPAPPPQAELKEAPPPPPPQETRSGLFGLSFDRRQPEQ